MVELLTTENLVALLTLTVLEVVLGIDNVIFIAILAGKLPASEQAKARQLGIGLAVITRILLLLSITWVVTTATAEIIPPFFGRETGLSGKDLILLIGGAFLIGKSTYEIHEKLEAHGEGSKSLRAASSLASVIIQIVLIDIVFSLDSVITAVGISNVLPIMIVAVVIAAAMMLFFSGAISTFVEKHPTMKILALAFLILIGTILVIEGWNHTAAEELHIKNYAYAAMAFSFFVELINMRFRSPSTPVQLHSPQLPTTSNQPVPQVVAGNSAKAAPRRPTPKKRR